MANHRSSTATIGSCRWSSAAFRALALTTLCSLGALAPAAARATRFHRVASGEAGLRVRADGSRWYAYQRTGGHVRAIDASSHRARRLDTRSGCALADVRFTRVLLTCDADPVAREVPLSGEGDVFDYPDLDPRDGRPFADSFGTLGRYWIGGGTCEDAGHCAQVYLNRRTQERRVVQVGNDEPDPSVPLADVDSPDLAYRDPAYLVDVRSGGYRLIQADDEPGTALTLRRGSRARTLSSCRPVACAHATLGARLVTWSQGARVDAYDIGARRTRRWRSPPGAMQNVVHTARRLLVEVAGADGARETLYKASVPRR